MPPSARGQGADFSKYSRAGAGTRNAKSGRFLARGFDDKVWQAIRREMEKLGDLDLRVGVLASKGGGARAGDSDFTLAEVAEAHEYGIPEIKLPERSFVRRTFIEKQDKIRSFLGQAMRLVATRRIDRMRALELVGAMAAGEVKLMITSGKITPELAQSTIDAKGSSKPLFDTGQLTGVISFEIVSLI